MKVKEGGQWENRQCIKLIKASKQIEQSKEDFRVLVKNNIPFCSHHVSVFLCVWLGLFMPICLCMHSSDCSREWGTHLWVTSCWQLDRGAMLLPHYIQSLQSLACRVLILLKNNTATCIATHYFSALSY